MKRRRTTSAAVNTTTKRCIYASGLLSGSIETGLRDANAEHDAKCAPLRILREAGCPIEGGDGEPPLKCLRTGDVDQSTVPRNKHSPVNRRHPEPKAERPARGESSGTGVGVGSGCTETASIVDLLEYLKAVKKELAANSDRARRTKERLAGTQAELAKTQVELTGTQAQVAETKARVARTETQVEAALAQLAWDRKTFEGTRAQLQGIQAHLQGTQAEVAAYQVQLAATLQVAQKARADLIQQRPFAEHLASLFN